MGAVALCLAGWAASVQGADCPQWGGSDQRNMVSSEKGLPDFFVPGRKDPTGEGVDPKSTENVKWTAQLGSQTYGNPTVAGGRVYVGTNDFALRDDRCKPTRGGLLMCLDEATGELVWQLVVPRREVSIPGALFDHLDLGLCSGATVDGDRVYVVTSGAEVVCLDAAGMANGNDGSFQDEGQFMAGPGNPPVEVRPTDADVLWRFDMIEALPSCPQDAACCSILIHDGLLYVGTSNGVDASHDKMIYPLAPSLIVLDKKTGRLVAADDEKIGTRLFHGMWTSPNLAKVGGKELILFGGGDGVCYAFEAVAKAGDQPVPLKKVWSFDCNPPSHKFIDGKPIPYRSGDKRICSKFGEFGNKDDGTHVGPCEIIATPVPYNNRIYVALGQDPAHGNGRGILTCFDATQTGDVTQTGKVWTFEGIQRSLSTVSIADGLLYVADIAGTIYCLDPDTGQLYWSHETGEETWASTLVADGKIYLGTRKSLWVLAAGKQKKVLNTIRVSSPLWCTPVAANGVLYVASQKYLWAVESPKGP